MQETQVQSPGQEDTLEKEMATHSNILTWKKSHGWRNLAVPPHATPHAVAKSQTLLRD